MVIIAYSQIGIIFPPNAMFSNCMFTVSVVFFVRAGLLGEQIMRCKTSYYAEVRCEIVINKIVFTP